MDGSGQRVAGDLGPDKWTPTAAGAHQGGRPTGEHMRDVQGTRPVDRPCGWGEAFAELTLLLPNGQLEALESAAAGRGMTMGQLLRRLIRNCLEGLDDTRLPVEPALPDAAADRTGILAGR